MTFKVSTAMDLCKL